MALQFADRVRCATITTGFGPALLGPPVYGHQAATGVITGGSQVRYVIEDLPQWEVGIGTYFVGPPESISRDTVESSSGGPGVHINLSGAATIFIAPDASFLNLLAGLGTAAFINTGTQGAVVGLLNAGLIFDGNDRFTGAVEIGTPTGGMPAAAGTLNAQGLQINGAAVTAGGPAQWNAGTVSALGASLAINSGTIDLAPTIHVTNIVAAGTASLAGAFEVGTPTGGMPASGTINAQGLQVNGVAVAVGSQPYTIAGFVPGALSSSQVLLFHKFAQAVNFPANFGATVSGGLSEASALALATASTVLTIAQCLAANDPTVGGNWTTVGTITYSAAGFTGAFASTGGAAVSFAQGDKLRVIGPATADTTLASVALTIAGNR